MKRLFPILFALLFAAQANAQDPNTHAFAQRNGTDLKLDIYKPVGNKNKDCCIIFIFGGGFISGERNSQQNADYCRLLAKEGYTAVAIDYRLGLKGVTHVGITAIKPLENAINMAVEDLYAATGFLLKNAAQLQINPKRIVLIGSSAGAVTALQADYYLANRHAYTKILPTDFKFAGIIPFAGAIFSREGKVDYKHAKPAPTFFVHGTKDKLVTYKKIQAFNIGFFGANELVKRFNKFGNPYFALRYKNSGHEVSGFMQQNMREVNWFIDTFVINQKWLQVDQTYFDPSIEQPEFGNFKPSDLYKKQKK